MGATLIIERPANPITRTEWEAWLNQSADCTITDKIRGSNPRTGRPINVPCESAGLWSRSDGKQDGYFQFYDGSIVPVDPDNAMIAKAEEIARALGARIVKK